SDADNAAGWLEAGASKVIVTSWLFEDGRLSQRRLDALAAAVTPEQLVIDLSCRRHGDGWRVAVNRWQTITDVPIEPATFERLAAHCSEFLIHAADVEGLRRGIDAELVEALARSCELPCTYAGGANDVGDLDRVAELSDGRIDLTFGSALDIFGGTEVRYADCVAYNGRA
ncbi:MAG: HisA/HisF-related TIM barrel protein, partial [Myxococcales bacterium]|nr:HisA/HisF-related TIM barrel protein [Myxococcales bacterium]